MAGAALNFKEKGISVDYLLQACVDQGLCVFLAAFYCKSIRIKTVFSGYFCKFVQNLYTEDV